MISNMERILNCLRKTPGRGETLEGICQFCLRFEWIDESVDEVKADLDSLVEKGIVKKIEIKGSSPIYKLAEEL